MDGDRVSRPSTTRRLLVVVFVFSAVVALAAAGRANSGALTGGFSPTIVSEGADVNGDGLVNGNDDANAFYGDTSIIDGKLDCDAWGVVANDGSQGDGTIDGSDDCSLVGYDGTPDGVTIEVVDGAFQVANGPLPTVFNAGDPANADIGDSDFAWSAIDGRVDSNGNEQIDSDDCHAGLIPGVDVLSNDNLDTNPCGFASSSNTADNGLLDFNNDQDITGGDSCLNGCFFGLDVSSGKVQEAECPGFKGDPRQDVIGTSGPDLLIGTAGPDIICGLGGNDTLVGAEAKDLLLGGRGADVIRGGDGRDVVEGGRGNDRLLGNDAGDRLFGNGGRDHLNGGQGFDRGFGGAGHDTFVSCEVRHQ
jgi:RTX calcium-binding nonapeptide repeat (4 copies)